jgi:hypothetical protein
MTLSTAKRTLTIFLLSPLALLLVAACGVQEQGGGGGENAVKVGNFTDWDANNNELSQQEFNQGVFGSIDADSSGAISQKEFNAFSKNQPWFNNINANFADWDANNNNELTQKEFSQGATNANLFGGWDANNNDMLVEREFRQGLEKPKG